MSRFAKSFALFLWFTGLLLGATDANAATCTSIASTAWNLQTTWGAAGTGCAGAPGGIPGAADTVTIANGNAVTVTAAAAAASISIAGGNTATSITITGTNTLMVSGAVTINAPTGNVTKQIAVGTGTLSAGGITITSGNNANRVSQVTVSTGAITVSGNIAFGGTASAARLVYTGTGTVNLTGNFGGGGTLTTAAGSILNFNGAAAQTAASYTTYNIVKVNNAAGLTMLGTSTIATLTIGDVTANSVFSDGGFQVTSAGTLNLTSGTLKLGAAAATTFPGFATRNISAGTTVEYASAVAQTVSATPAYQNLTLSGGGNKTAAAGLTVNGNFTIVAGTFTAGAFTHTVGGNWSNSGIFTAGTSTVTFNGTNSTLGGTVATTFNNLTLNKTAGNNVSIVCGTPSPTVNATLTLTSGDIITSGTSPACATDCASQVPVIVAAAGTITGGSVTSYVQGALRKMFNAAATLNFRAVAGQDEFPVGDTASYTPVEITAGTTSTAGSVTACVTPTDHPQVTTPVATTGIDAAKSVNRYWSLTTATINTTAAPVDATFKFVAGDVDAGATTANFIVEGWNGTNWSPTTLVAAGATSTQASNIDLTSTTNDIAIGEPLLGLTALPGQFNAFETTTPAGAVLGMVQTKQSGVALSVRLARLNVAKNAIDTTYTQAGVTVELLDSSDNTGALNAVTACRPIGAAVGQWHPIAGTSQLVNFNLGVISPVSFTVANSYRDVRVHVVKAGVGAGEGCSTDRFAIRPASLTITAHDATWATAGTGRPLANTGASGGNVHKAATSASPLPFTLRATPLPATATNYDGTPTTVAGFPTCGGLCTTVGALSFTAGSWTAAGSGVRENATANYSEAGTFNLQLEDATYASVDAVDGSTAAMRTIPATAMASVEIGRFVPDHFDVTALIAPTFKTFNAADAACSSGAAPRRTFTYIGQPFGYLTTPQATIFARNAAGAPTANYQGTGGSGLWKIGDLTGTTTPAVTKDCTTDSNICTFITDWTTASASSKVVETYTYTLTPPNTPGWDNNVATATAASINTGTGRISFSISDTLAFLRNTTTPQGAFTANITNTLTVQDASENAVANNGIISTATPLVFNGAGSGIDFDGGGASNGKEFRYGRLKLSNAYGSELLDIRLPMRAEYYTGANSWALNSLDNCTVLPSSSIALGNYLAPPAGTAVSATNMGVAPTDHRPVSNTTLVGGSGPIVLAKPSPVASGSFDVVLNLGTGIVSPNSCVTGAFGGGTAASLGYLLGNWCGSNYDRAPSARVKLGSSKAPYIYLRERY